MKLERNLLHLGMKILYKNKKAKEQFDPMYMKAWKYNETVRKRIIKIKEIISVSDSLYDIATYPTFFLEKLKGDRKAEWSIRVGNTGYRITLIPCDEKENLLIGGDVLAKSKTIKTVMITEVSNHYE